MSICTRWDLSGRLDGGSGTLPSEGTIAFWIKSVFDHDDGVNRTYFSQEGPSGTHFRIQKFTDDRLYCGFFDAGHTNQRAVIEAGDYAIDQNRWHHIACTWKDGNFTRAYFDGVLKKEVLALTIVQPSGVRTFLNHAPAFGNSIAACRMGYAALWNRALTPTEIASLYGNGSTPNTFATAVNPSKIAGTVNRWPMRSLIGISLPSQDEIGGDNLTGSNVNRDYNEPPIDEIHQLQYEVDDRPVQVIWTGPAVWVKNDYYGAQQASLIRQLTERPVLKPDPRGNRFVISHPYRFGPEPQASHYHPMKAEQRGWIRDIVKTARKVRPFTMGITVDQTLTSNDLTKDFPIVASEYKDPLIPTIKQHQDLYWGGCVCPWDHLLPGGLYEWWGEGPGATLVINGENPSNEYGNQWREFFNAKGLHMGAEAINTCDGLGATFLRSEVDTRSAMGRPMWALGTPSFLLSSSLAHMQMPPGKPELHAFCHDGSVGGYSLTPTEMQALRDRGLIVGPDWQQDAEWQTAFG